MKRAQLRNRGEAAFAAEMDAAGKMWFHQPKQFKLPAPIFVYTPDFYVIEDLCFYEVCGTRQAYSYARKKIEAFRIAYPDLRLDVFNAGAWVDKPRGPRVAIPVHSNARRALGAGLENIFRRSSCPLVRSAFTLAIGRGYRTLTELAQTMGISPVSMWQLGEHLCSARMAHNGHRLANDILAKLEDAVAIRA